MKLNSGKLKENLDTFNKDIEKSEQTSNKLKDEVGEMSAAVENIVDIGEYNSITKTMLSELRSEISDKKNDIGKDLESVNTKIESNKADNGEMIKGLSKNIETMGKKTTFEVASKAGNIIEKSSANMKQALEDRNDIAHQLDDSQKELQKVSNFTDNIKL